ncbi:unannotated protein [freshwater metagenome]|uniref:Unannotated protein n=1 Tax=freshwater metagenome TaxID=449393 RepID=A0A6J6EGP4_9ZZZZ
MANTVSGIDDVADLGCRSRSRVIRLRKLLQSIADVIRVDC